MSSHHFVKEDQEPALLILNEKAISFERVQELLEWSPTVIVADQAIEKVIGWGVKIDLVLCAESKVDSYKESLSDQAPLQFISYRNENESISTTYFFLKAEKYKAVNILIDHASQFDSIQTFTGIDVEVFYQNKRWVYVHSKFEKWVAMGTQFYIYPEPVTISIDQNGLTKKLLCLRDGIVSIKSETAFWLGESLES